MTAQVQRQIAGLFVAEECGSHQLKGVPEQVMLFRLVRASGGGRRAGQRHLTPLVGREEELGMLRRWDRARKGNGQLVLIIGEPGFRKIPPDRGISYPAWRDATHLGRMGLLSASAEYALTPDSEWGRQRFGGADPWR